ncbi:MAG: L,D-transpeptidase [Flavobacterium sp.]|nr:MAG: L,D-transpeptidase [Flavobacterium sp.]
MNMKKYTSRLYLLGITLFITILISQSCKKSHSDIGKEVFKETRNNVFKEVETGVFVAKFREAFAKKQATFKNPKFLRAFYEKNDYEPVLLMKNLPAGKLREASAIIANAGAHGIDPEVFKAKNLNNLIAKIYDKQAVKSVEDAYQVLIDLELAAANAFTDYSNAVQFGLISPRKIYAQYYIETKRPDSASFNAVFNTTDVKSYLDSIQPKNEAYVTMQKALSGKFVIPGKTAEESDRILKVNLERLRWKNRPTEGKYVWVNIPDFSLDVMDNDKSVLRMKVCVGEGRGKENIGDLKEYDENDLKKDRYFNRETPQLNSLIHSVQVNPIWNIPESIATNEITKYAAKDPHYLSNNNIDVFKDGKKLEDPETIDWSEAGAGKAYSFKQRPGDDNSLGKIKFLFANRSSVYLHDTPAKAMFNQSMRAVSHGCVRVEQPLELAKALFGSGEKFELIKKEMSATTPIAKDVSLKDKVPVYLVYYTCWQDSEGKIQYRNDIYGQDEVLYTYMQKLI